MKVIILLFSSLLTVHVGSEYTDEYGRKMLAMSAAAFARNPGICLSKIMPKEEKWILISVNEAVCDKRSDKCAVFVAISHIVRKILVSFRGTNTITQLVAESLDILKEEHVFYDLGRVDTYFLNALEKVWHPVRKVLADFDLINYDVVFTGYSLGGALASIASLKAYKDNLRASNKISLITYGMPRVGNYLFASNHDRIITNSYRIVHKNDLIVHVPPCHDDEIGSGCIKSLDQRPYHHGTEIWYNNDMREGNLFKVCLNDSEDPECSNSLINKYSLQSHLYYFGKRVSLFGANNCEMPYDSASSSRKLGNFQKSVYYLLSIIISQYIVVLIIVLYY